MATADWTLTPSPTWRPPREKAFRVLAIGTAAAITCYGAASAFGAGLAQLDLVFTFALLALPPFVWWAFAIAPRQLRRFCGLLAPAATLWLAGSLVWYGYFLANGSKVPTPLGLWDLLFLAAYSLVLASVWVAMRPAITLRHAASDASVVIAAGVALGAALIGHGLEHGVSTESLATLVRPLFGVVTLTLIASAALGSWEGLPRSIVLFALGQAFITIGSIVYSFEAVQTAYLDDRWANVGWFAGAAISMLAASVLILGVDRPVRALRRPPIPNHPAGAKGVLYLAAGGVAVSVGVALSGYLAGHAAVLLVGLIASAWIGVAMALRARSSIREVETAYDRLDHAHLQLERTKDELADANEQLARTNVQIRAVHGAFEDLLELADERTNGRLRELIEEAGEDIARLLAQHRGRGG